METKNTHLYNESPDFSFGEKRFLHMAEPVPEGPKPQGEAPKDEKEQLKFEDEKITAFVDKINKAAGKEIFDAKKILENNPYRDALADFLAKFKKEDFDFDMVVVNSNRMKALSLIKKGEDPKFYCDIVNGINTDAYLALFWPTISPKLDKVLAGKNITPPLIELAVDKKTSEFREAVLLVAQDKEVDKEVLEKVLKELDELRPQLNAEAAKTRITERARIRLELLKKEVKKGEKPGEKHAKPVETEKPDVKKPGKPAEPEKPKEGEVKLPETCPLTDEKFAEVLNSRVKQREIDQLKLNILREGNKINAQKWDHTTLDGIKQVYSDCKNVGININDPFYQTFFATLANALDLKKNPHLADAKYKVWFQDPASHMKELEGLSPDASRFAKAYQHLQYLKGVFLTQDDEQLKVLAAQKDLDSDVVGETVTSFVRNNLSKFNKAIRENDYATAGLYAAGAYALYKAYQKFAGGGHEGKKDGIDFGKWLTYGAAIYMGNKFLKNAGYDVLKMSGMKAHDFEVKGTPLAAMDKILRTHPEFNTTFKDIDYEVVLRVSEASLVDLDELYKESNIHGIKFIHPSQFPSHFADLARVWPFDMGMGEKGLSEYTGMANTKLTPSQREYIRVGQQLYKVAFALRTSYNETLKKDHPAYAGKSYEDVLKDPTYSLGKVRHLLGAIVGYAPGERKRGLFGSAESIDKVDAVLQEAFAGKEVGLFLERQVAKTGHFEGKIRGFPVVFVLTDKSVYRVYLKGNYEGLDKPGVNFCSEIPADAGNERDLAVEGTIKAIDAKVAEFLSMLNFGQQKAAKPVYKNGEWVAEVTLPGAEEFGIEAQSTEAVIEIWPDGKGLILRTKLGGTRINVSETIARSRSIDFVLIPKIVGQKKFHALRPLGNAGMLKIKDDTPGDKKFDLLIGDTGLFVTVEYDSEKKIFSLADKDQEETVVSDPRFVKAYVDAVEGDKNFELNKNIADVKKLITDACPEGFVGHFFQSLVGDKLKSPLGGFNLDALSGTVPEYFAEMVLETSRAQVFARAGHMMLKKKTFESIDKIYTETFEDFNSKLVSLRDTIATENAKLGRKGEKWDRDLFMTRVIDPLRNTSARSATYAHMKADFEYTAYGLAGGLLKKSDLSRRSHLVAGKLMGVFVYHTAHLDNRKYKGKLIDLDRLPPQGEKVDKDSLRGYAYLNYMEYVKTEIFNKAQIASSESRLDSVPNASANGFWQIKDFEEWFGSKPDYAPLNPLDTQPGYKHEVGHKSGEHSELDKALIKEYDKTVAFLLNVYGPDVLDFHEIENYLREASQGAEEDNLGIFVVYEKNEETVCKIWRITDNIALLSNKKRSLRIQLIQREIDKFVEFVFTAKDERTGKLRFFSTKPSLNARILQRWPWLDRLNPFS